MSAYRSLFFVYLIIASVAAVPFSNGNGTNFGLLGNGRISDEPTCKTDDGRVEVPLNGKIRLGTNPCKVCTCTITGFSCEDQCEIIPASTSVGAPRESSTTSSPPPAPDPSTSPPSLPLSPVPIINGNMQRNSTSAPPSNGNTDDGSSATTAGASWPRMAAREYAFADCSEVYMAGKRTSGIYEIWPGASPKPFRVLCDMDTDGGGWTVFQRRGDYSQQSNFFASWLSYKRGFGDLNRDFWLGNEKIHFLTNQDEYRLHIDIQDFNDQSRHVDYAWFFITNEQTKYTLNLGRYMSSSTGGDSLSYNRGMRFSTRDQNNDPSTSTKCAENYKSGWWHYGCTLSNLNGVYLRGNDSTATGVFWSGWLGGNYSLKSCAMKVRPANFNAEMLL